ncbi:MAG: ABC transporter ATP-binding protein [Bryobacteraceae bacterium]
MQSNVVITLENVTQRYRVIQERPDTLRELFTRFLRHQSEIYDFEAVRNVSFTVGKGEMLGIVGRNGSGKSTLLKVIAGVFRPSAGKVEVTGTIAPLIELGAGFHGELTGRENILINGLILGYSKREMIRREQSIVDFAEIGDFIDVPVKQYSSGMYMRLAFSVATEVDPDILVIDEILAVGDFAFQQKCKERLRDFRDRGKTILLVTHSASDVVSLCDRAILIDQGNMLFDGHPEEAMGMYFSLSMLDAAPEPEAAAMT